MTIGTGLALLGMWAAIGVIGWRNPEAGFGLGIFAAIATLAIGLS